ncbi:MAG: hypothetical protein ABFC62_10720 [Clostridiaceae bacterium]|nr:hypothetical protein [Eubacteriales bacterium]
MMNNKPYVLFNDRPMGFLVIFSFLLCFFLNFVFPADAADPPIVTGLFFNLIFLYTIYFVFVSVFFHRLERRFPTHRKKMARVRRLLLVFPSRYTRFAAKSLEGLDVGSRDAAVLQFIIGESEAEMIGYEWQHGLRWVRIGILGSLVQPLLALAFSLWHTTIHKALLTFFHISIS